MPALKEAHLAGRPIYIPEGIYDISGDWDSDYSHMPRLIGAGKGRTVIRQQSAASLWNQHKNMSDAFIASRKSLRTTVTANAPAGSLVLNFNTTGYTADDYVYVRKNIL